MAAKRGQEHHAAGHRGAFGPPCGWDAAAVEAVIAQWLGAPPPDPKPARIMRADEVEARTGLSRAEIWRRERRGTFPRRVRLTSDAAD
jgi:hypothetical protein